MQPLSRGLCLWEREMINRRFTELLNTHTHTHIYKVVSVHIFSLRCLYMAQRGERLCSFAWNVWFRHKYSVNK